MFLKSTIMALAMAGTALATTNTADAQNYNRNRPAVTIGFGDVAMGYRDGYTGNDHNWHRWQHNNDYVSYRSHHRGQYHDWNHDRGQR